MTGVQKSEQRLFKSGNRKKATSLLNNWARELDAHAVMLKPEVPGILNQPAYLIVRSLGKLAAIFVSQIPSKGPYWSFVLSTIEDLFEAKTVLGSKTIVGLVVINDSGVIHPLNHDMNRLLRELFDFFHFFQISDLVNQGVSSLTELSRTFYNSQPNEEYVELWDSERKTMAENLEGFSNGEASGILRVSEYGDWPLGAVKDVIESRIKQELSGSITVVRNAQVFNLKQWFLETAKQYYFVFDFEIRFEVPVLLQVVQGCTSSTYLTDLRSLASKARLIRYRIGSNGKLLPRSPDYQLWLAVTGHLRGPQYDETRYVRAMRAVGWNPVRAELVSAGSLRRLQ
ncbi:MAG: hypothetical protein MN733_07950 [Nitrososphaera sp.]|nr:hypothetical protein [Nitrososphaera sp.]MCI0648286.1 hypothetical protein [Chloroflexota bacterium]